jgi:hypothetical protein
VNSLSISKTSAVPAQSKGDSLLSSLVAAMPIVILVGAVRTALKERAELLARRTRHSLTN